LVSKWSSRSRLRWLERLNDDAVASDCFRYIAASCTASERSLHDVDYLINLFVPQMRIDRQRENVPRLFFGDRKLTLAITQIFVAPHQVDRPPVLNAAFQAMQLDAL